MMKKEPEKNSIAFARDADLIIHYFRHIVHMFVINSTKAYNVATFIDCERFSYNKLCDLFDDQRNFVLILRNSINRTITNLNYFRGSSLFSCSSILLKNYFVTSILKDNESQQSFD